KDGKGPRRSILFIALAAEEKGLLGSQFYVENPIFPLAQTVACINIDMIGRIDDKHLNGDHNYIHVIGVNKLSTDLKPIVEKANASVLPFGSLKFCEEWNPFFILFLGLTPTLPHTRRYNR